MVSGKNIFISALDWGLGHATRCVPIIKTLEKHNQILIGVTPGTKFIFQETFPHLKTVEVPAYNIRYSKYLPVWLKVLFDWPRINALISKEGIVLKEIIQQHQINYIISDNRFGLYSKDVYSVFITHQLFIQSPILKRLAQLINKKFILHFHEVWVPDYADEKISLSGKLSHGNQFHSNVKFIGPLSRLTKSQNSLIQYDYLVMLSGPEPLHTQFAEHMEKYATSSKSLRFAFISSLVKVQEKTNIAMFYQADTFEIANLISQSTKVICRSGYSSLMDLHHLEKKNIILFPTKGQTEQEYLAKYWCKNFGAEIFDLKKL